MSLFDRFPQIESSTILEIARHEFRPMDLYKLDPSAIQPRAGSLRDYPTFASLFEPLLMYFSVLATYAATSGGDAGATLAIARGGYTYSAHLSKLNRRFRWPAVLQYHTAFFLNRRREMVHGDYSGWLRSDTELMNEHLFGHGRAPPTRRYVHVVFK
ncbi:hypothetical protein BDZ97DRAFT_1901309 [Flammula alnicola]|nr:hypothetical protein BDZ97DRAFT_1901309 [Flammula alnicola]